MQKLFKINLTTETELVVTKITAGSFSVELKSKFHVKSNLVNNN